MKEELSKAYIGMIAGAAGLTLGSWSQDYDCMDVTLSSIVDYSPHRCAPKIDVQLKCTGQTSVVQDDHIAWSLAVRTVEKMSKLNRSNPMLLCVLVTAADYWDWLHHDQEGLLAKSHMYWLWGHQMPPAMMGQETQTVHLPDTNRVTPESILTLMKEASEWQPQIL
ncbi:DUF4365 domain-containing protein [Nocardioides sp. NPDC047086]|uniref:DUF4365 domain-containing protein n=1 Tax=Nocardioides sp. NPDC047086 TaxID=3154810 RepID=UPI0034083640